MIFKIVISSENQNIRETVRNLNATESVICYYRTPHKESFFQSFQTLSIFDALHGQYPAQSREGKSRV